VVATLPDGSGKVNFMQAGVFAIALSLPNIKNI
jgi:hypothetical protein